MKIAKKWTQGCWGNIMDDMDISKGVGLKGLPTNNYSSSILNARVKWYWWRLQDCKELRKRCLGNIE